MQQPRWTAFHAVCTWLILLVAPLAFASTARAQAPSFDIDLPAQPLEASLRQLADSQKLQIVYVKSDLAGLQASALKGRFSVVEALEKLTAGTPLVGSFNGTDTIFVKPRGSSASPPGTASQQMRTSDAVRLDEIKVTAQKREERAFDVPISIVALNSEELQKRRISNIDDLPSAVPGLAIVSAGDQRRIMLRGISNLLGNFPLIGLYLDEASVTSGPYFQMDLRTYDLERVEVLRGPQGTLYGEGSVGGTIRFITKDPQLDRPAMGANVSAMFTQGGAPSQRIETMLNAPLIENELGVRVAAVFNHDGGWIDQPAADRKDINGENLAHIRIKGLWQPNAQFSASAMAVVHRNDLGVSRGEDANGNYTQTFNLLTTPSTRDAYEIYNLTLAYDFQTARLLSTTTYSNQDRKIREYAFRQPLTPNPPRYDIYEPLILNEGSNKNEELRLTSTANSPLQWTVGAFFRDYSFESQVPKYYFGLPIQSGAPLPSPFGPFIQQIESKSWAVFGDASYKMTDRLTLGTGLRYFKDDQKFGNGSPVRQTGSFDSVNPRFYGQFKVSDEVNAYASAAKGFRSGGFNSTPSQPPYDPESVWTYEFGTKVSLGKRFYADAALFYSDYKDYQITALVPGAVVAMTTNAGNVHISGVELSLNWMPADLWTIGFAGNYIRSRFYEINGTKSAFSVGDPVDLIPNYMFTVSAQRDFQWNGKPGFARVDYSKQGKSTYGSLRSIGPWYYSESDVIDLLNFNLSLRWNHNLLLFVYGKNMLNDRGYVTPQVVDDLATRSRPRTFGFGFSLEY